MCQDMNGNLVATHSERKIVAHGSLEIYDIVRLEYISKSAELSFLSSLISFAVLFEQFLSSHS